MRSASELAVSSLVVAMTITKHYACLRKECQAELAWVAWLTLNGHPSQYKPSSTYSNFVDVSSNIITKPYQRKCSKNAVKSEKNGINLQNCIAANLSSEIHLHTFSITASGTQNNGNQKIAKPKCGVHAQLNLL